MANVFLSREPRDVETALMLEKANVLDIGKAVAYTDGNRVFVNTPDNLFKILPAYDDNMLKWLLWHERMHMEFKHHNRFFKYLSELDEKKTKDKFQVTKDEVNIIMDILVHDWMSSKFPELIETAVNNCAQMRDRNALMYTFETYTLEEMLEEYRAFKEACKGESKAGDKTEAEDKSEDKTEAKDKSEQDDPEKDATKPTKEGKEKSHEEEDTETPHQKGEDKIEKEEPEIIKDAKEPEKKAGHHNETDWSKLEEIDSKEFITKDEGDNYIYQINELKRKKLKLGKLTETLNSLATSQRKRTYAKPSPIKVGSGVVLKGSRPGRVALALCFDASGSMYTDMDTFKDIISKSIPQAMDTPTLWFAGGCNPEGCADPEGRTEGRYFKGKFKDFMGVWASGGYSDDGDRTIELCWRMEQKGLSPIGITDGGGRISWAETKLKQLKRTIFVGDSKYWLEDVKKINPNIQTLYTGNK